MIYYNWSIIKARALYSIQLTKKQKVRKKERTNEITMKKRILALILAGLLTASMASCVASGGDNGKLTGDGTEPKQTRAMAAATASFRTGKPMDFFFVSFASFIMLSSIIPMASVSLSIFKQNTFLF